MMRLNLKKKRKTDTAYAGGSMWDAVKFPSNFRHYRPGWFDSSDDTKKIVNRQEIYLFGMDIMDIMGDL